MRKQLCIKIMFLIILLSLTEGFSKQIGIRTIEQSSDFLILPELMVRDTLVAQFESSNLPLVYIDTYGQDIVESPRIIAEMGIIYNGIDARNYFNDSFNNYLGRVNIKLRGSTSLDFPKQQYSFETQDSLGNNLNVKLIGLPKENDWILFDPYNDKTLIRDVLSYHLAREMGHYATRTKLCELVLNGDYHGVYVLMEKIKRDKNRVNISSMDSNDVAGDSLTGGYIIKIDKEPWNPGFESSHEPFSGCPEPIKYQYHYPDPDDITPEQEEYIKNYVDKFENVMASWKYSDPDSGCTKYLDINSAVDYFLINELTKNIDGYRLSSFMYKDRDSKGGKLTLGPAWDYNLGFGNADYFYGWRTEGWVVEFFFSGDEELTTKDETYFIPFWWNTLFNDPTFEARVNKRWFELRQTALSESHITGLIDSLTNYLSEARVRNFDRWPVLGEYVWPNKFIGETYEDEIDYMKGWIHERLDWMDSQITPWYNEVEEQTRNSEITHFKLVNYPNPFNPATKIEYSVPTRARVQLSVFNIAGQLVRSFAVEQRLAGVYAQIWNGLNDQGKPIPSGIYITRLQANDFVMTRKITLIR
jgi:hypothetical protein